uniref:Cathepsin propeptide inhibitor domain-containing protein n=1 Tax=Tetranychus urticae TaxID=32264 RepID=T1K761_TETUR
MPNDFDLTILTSLPEKAFLAIVHSKQPEETKYGNSYESKAEEHYRRSLFPKKSKKIKACNERQDNSEVTYRIGTTEEAKHIGFTLTVRRPAPLIHNANYTAKAQAFVDRTKEIVSVVKEQRNCGVCCYRRKFQNRTYWIAHK